MTGVDPNAEKMELEQVGQAMHTVPPVPFFRVRVKWIEGISQLLLNDWKGIQGILAAKTLSQPGSRESSLALEGGEAQTVRLLETCTLAHNPVQNLHNSEHRNKPNTCNMAQNPHNKEHSH